MNVSDTIIPVSGKVSSYFGRFFDSFLCIDATVFAKADKMRHIIYQSLRSANKFAVFQVEFSWLVELVLYSNIS